MIQRPLTLADLDAVLAVRAAVEVAEDLPIRTPRDELEEELTSEGVQLDADSLGLFDDAGRCLAYGFVDLAATASAEARFATLHLAVHPAEAGRGHGRQLAQSLEARGTARLADLPHPDPPRLLRTFLYSTQIRAARMAERAGFTVLRYYDEMTCDVREPRAKRPAPDGVAIVAWDPGRGEEARLVKNAAFADHWGSSPSTETSWDRMLGTDRFHPELSAMALDAEGEMIGIIVSHVYEEDWAAVGREEVWVGLIGVRSSQRGRGIASALIERVLAAAATAGLSHATLGVDTENPTGAHGLYTSMGFRLTASTHMWAKPAG